MTAETKETNAGRIFDKLVCEACGKEFFCGANVGRCWCFAVELKTKTLAELREKFQRCLCENCLGLAANSVNERQVR